MSEAHVFESHTRPGNWFWLAPDGRNGWTQSENDAWRKIGKTAGTLLAAEHG